MARKVSPAQLEEDVSFLARMIRMTDVSLHAAAEERGRLTEIAERYERFSERVDAVEEET